eukprot:15457851-Alexandrium_andersonii.AAC.1
MGEDNDPSAALMRDLTNRAEAGLAALEKERAATVDGGPPATAGPEATPPPWPEQQAPVRE